MKNIIKFLNTLSTEIEKNGVFIEKIQLAENPALFQYLASEELGITYSPFNLRIIDVPGDDEGQIDYHQTVMSLKDHLHGKNMEELLMNMTESG